MVIFKQQGTALGAILEANIWQQLGDIKQSFNDYTTKNLILYHHGLNNVQ